MAIGMFSGAWGGSPGAAEAEAVAEAEAEAEAEEAAAEEAAADAAMESEGAPAAFVGFRKKARSDDSEKGGNGCLGRWLGCGRPCARSGQSRASL